MRTRINRREVLTSAAAALSVAALTVVGVGRSVKAADTGPKTHAITITNFEFAPNNLIVSVHDTIIWTNRDIIPHTASADDGSWDTGHIGVNETASIDVTDAMGTSYFCRFHPSMKAGLTTRVVE